MRIIIMLSILITLSLASLSLSLSSSLHSSSQQQNPLHPGDLTFGPIPSYPTIQPTGGNLTCHLDLSSELFGGVSAACSTLDRDRCCPVLAAWLFAAHARSALSLPTSPPATSPLSDDVLPLIPDDSQKCVDSLHSSLEAKNIKLPTPNSTCDTVLCFCGIRLHQIGSLTCPAAFNLTGAAAGGGGGNVTSGGAGGNGTAMATPTAAVRQLERDCRNSSFAGCTRCLHSLQKLKGDRSTKGMSDREARMFGRDCELMGLTWLLARNKTMYIPTVSAVIRAVLYSSRTAAQPYKCRPDQDNMPLAVDSLQFQKLDSSSASFAAASTFALAFSVYSLHMLLFLSFWGLWI